MTALMAEVAAIQTVARVLDGLDAPARERVLEWAQQAAAPKANPMETLVSVLKLTNRLFDVIDHHARTLKTPTEADRQLWHDVSQIRDELEEAS